MTDAEFAKDIRARMMRTAAYAGLPMLSDDFCAQLLAWTYVYGGSCEAVVMDGRMHPDIQYAQIKANLLGGEIPNIWFVQEIQKYVREAEALLKEKPPEKHKHKAPDWAWAIVDRYNLKGFPFERIPVTPPTEQLQLF